MDGVFPERRHDMQEQTRAQLFATAVEGTALIIDKFNISATVCLIKDPVKSRVLHLGLVNMSRTSKTYLISLTPSKPAKTYWRGSPSRNSMTSVTLSSRRLTLYLKCPEALQRRFLVGISHLQQPKYIIFVLRVISSRSQPADTGLLPHERRVVQEGVLRFT